MTKQMKQTEWEKRFDKLADDLFVRNVTTPDIDTDIHLGDSEEACDKVKAFIKQEIKRVIGEDEVEFKVNGKQKLEYKASDSYYNPVRNQLKAEQRREVGIK